MIENRTKKNANECNLCETMINIGMVYKSIDCVRIERLMANVMILDLPWNVLLKNSIQITNVFESYLIKSINNGIVVNLPHLISMIKTPGILKRVLSLNR